MRFFIPLLIVLCGAWLNLSTAATNSTADEADCVILLHGLARTYRSMLRLEKALDQAGYRVANIDYPSREQSVQALARVVMLAPPNQGSEVVDRWRKVPGFEWLNGPAGSQLGTGPDSIVRQLGPVDYPVGIIAGTQSVNLILSISLPNPDDGKVSVISTKLQGMIDFITMPVAHPFIAQNDLVIQQAMRFLETERFNHADAKSTKLKARRQTLCNQAAELTRCDDALDSSHPAD